MQVETDKEGYSTTACELLVRKVFVLYPLLITFVNRYCTEWFKLPTVKTNNSSTLLSISSLFRVNLQ